MNLCTYKSVISPKKKIFSWIYIMIKFPLQLINDYFFLNMTRVCVCICLYQKLCRTYVFKLKWPFLSTCVLLFIILLNKNLLFVACIVLWITINNNYIVLPTNNTPCMYLTVLSRYSAIWMSGALDTSPAYLITGREGRLPWVFISGFKYLVHSNKIK